MNSKTIVSQYRAEFSEPPKETPADKAVDGPLLGNGDMGVAMGGDAREHHFILCKNDLWRLQHRYGESCPVPFGHLAITLDGFAGANYHVTQDLYTATTTGTFTSRNSTVTLQSYVAATRNLLVLNISLDGRSVDIRVALCVADGRGAETRTGKTHGVCWGQRAFTEGVDVHTGAATAWALVNGNGDGEQERKKVERPTSNIQHPTSNTNQSGPCAAEHLLDSMLDVERRTLDVRSEASKETSPGPDGSFVLTPGQSATLILAMDSVFKHEDYLHQAIDLVSSKPNLSEIRQAHLAWWADYWEKSYVSIDDPVIEKQYYLSLYGMGSCSRDPDFPPPIFGWTTTDSPLWAGDYHLNYNHQAPFYGLARANRLAQADPHDAPFFDFMERAAWHCREMYGFEGGIYPVGIGPKGIETTYHSEKYYDDVRDCVEHGGLFYGQRTNGSYGLVNMAPRWHTTLDLEYGRKIYPFVLQMAVFWQNYVTWVPFDSAQDGEAGRFVIENDSCHEGSGPDLNSCVSLALCRLALTLALDLTRALEKSPGHCGTWEHILKHLSVGGTREREGEKVFRYTENGRQWWKNNTIGIQHIYPAGQIDLDSDPELLLMAQNTIDLMRRWHDTNGSNSFFPAAVRIGYDPAVILRELRVYSQHAGANGFQRGNPHGIENLSTVPNTINEMLCMGHKGVIRLFPVWPKNRDAAFVNIRCRGAFLVSGEIKNSGVRRVSIFSEKGGDCAMVNPWPARNVRVLRNGEPAEIAGGNRFVLKTAPGETLNFK